MKDAIKAILKFFLPIVTGCATDVIGELGDKGNGSSRLIDISKKILGSCKIIKQLAERGKIAYDAIRFVGRLLGGIGQIAAGGSLVGLFKVVSPAIDAYQGIKKIIRSKAATAVVNAANAASNTIGTADSADGLKQYRLGRKQLRNAMRKRIVVDKMIVDMNLKATVVSVRRSLAKSIGKAIKSIEKIKVKNPKGKAIVKKIVDGLKKLQKKIDVPVPPKTFLAVLGSASAVLGGLIYLGKYAAPFLPNPVGAIVAILGGVSISAKRGVDVVKEGVETYEDIKRNV